METIEENEISFIIIKIIIFQKERQAKEEARLAEKRRLEKQFQEKERLKREKEEKERLEKEKKEKERLEKERAEELEKAKRAALLRQRELADAKKRVTCFL